MAVDANETEVKYDAPAGMALPDLDALPQVAGTSRADEEHLEAEYYDTADLRLMRAGITLRRRLRRRAAAGPRVPDLETGLPPPLPAVDALARARPPAAGMGALARAGR